MRAPDAIHELLPFPGGNGDQLMLIDHDQLPARPFRNLLRLTPRGGLVWTAELPEDTAGTPLEGIPRADAYMEAGWEGAALMATSLSGWRVRIDVETGKILTRERVK